MEFIGDISNEILTVNFRGTSKVEMGHVGRTQHGSHLALLLQGRTRKVINRGEE